MTTPRIDDVWGRPGVGPWALFTDRQVEGFDGVRRVSAEAPWSRIGRVVRNPERFVPIVRDVIDREQGFLDAHPGDETVLAELVDWRDLLAALEGRS